jgi:hypothetical protein
MEEVVEKVGQVLRAYKSGGSSTAALFSKVTFFYPDALSLSFLFTPL